MHFPMTLSNRRPIEISTNEYNESIPIILALSSPFDHNEKH
jgi:hypothetical protein